jgi:hypothetical protein
MPRAVPAARSWLHEVVHQGPPQDGSGRMGLGQPAGSRRDPGQTACRRPLTAGRRIGATLALGKRAD